MKTCSGEMGYRATDSHSRHYMPVTDQPHVPAPLSPWRISQYPLNIRVVGPQSRHGQFCRRKSLAPATIWTPRWSSPQLVMTLTTLSSYSMNWHVAVILNTLNKNKETICSYNILHPLLCVIRCVQWTDHLSYWHWSVLTTQQGSSAGLCHCTKLWCENFCSE
jgi:hypothetical protein